MRIIYQRVMSSEQNIMTFLVGATLYQLEIIIEIDREIRFLYLDLFGASVRITQRLFTL